MGQAGTGPLLILGSSPRLLDYSVAFDTSTRMGKYGLQKHEGNTRTLANNINKWLQWEGCTSVLHFPCYNWYVIVPCNRKKKLHFVYRCNSSST